eukprot:GGOE01053444.1.p1 GENE.GGOE01053444.1~~GGOE01053444.1.p1  ORF type:complete len:348 (+),score=96.29 GGOE01053444.1:52-1044(+)
MEDDTEEELCEYERQRLAHIQRNVEYMHLMGLIDAKQSLAEGLAQTREEHSIPPRQRQVKVPTPPEQLRRSDRLRGKSPQYTECKIEALDEALERPAKPRKRTTEDKEERRQEMVAATRQWLEESRRSMAVLGGGQSPPCKAEEWHDEAVRRWGVGVEACDTADWEAYVLSRLSKPPPPSPLDLLQEYYAHDTWQLLVACALMSRVASWSIKHGCISSFFEKCPTPSAAITTDSAILERILHPLGLLDVRLRTVMELSQKFLALPMFCIDLGAAKVWGCGAFTVDSYRIFCRDEGGQVEPSDSTLQSFVRWRRRVPDQRTPQRTPSDHDT